MERLLLTISLEEFETLYLKHLPATIYRFKQRGCSEEDAKDLAQTAYANACPNLGRLDDAANWTIWMRTIERNVWNNHCRRFHTQKRQGTELSFDERIDDAEKEEAALDAVLASEVSDRLGDCIERLPDKRKQVVTFFYFHEMSILEISRRLGIEPNTVKVHLHNARKSLKECLAQGEEP